MPLSRLQPVFNFAGFTFPKYVFTLPRGTFAARISQMRKPVTGPYYHAPRPITKNDPGSSIGFYLDDAGQPFGRWKWADDVVNLKHRGWYMDEHCDETIRGVVVMLPHGKFLAGWSMGEGMASGVERDIFTDIEEAAHAADECARVMAENEKEYRENLECEE